MDLEEAWRVLGRDLAEIVKEARALPKEGRLPYLEGLLAEAKRVEKALLGAHHPDRGGDPRMFRRVKEAYSVVEDSTVQARESDRKAADVPTDRNSVRIVVDPLE